MQIVRYPTLLSVMATSAVLTSCGREPTRPEPARGTRGTSAADVTALATKAVGTITIVLDMQPNRPTDVSFETAGKKLRDFVLDDDVTSQMPNSRTFSDLKPGSYTVTEAALSGLTVRDITCESSPSGGTWTDNNTIDVANRTVTIQLERGESVICTFVGYLPIWKDGDVITYGQENWGEPVTATNAAGLMASNFNALYAAGLTVGIYPAGSWMLFGDAASLLVYLPAGGAPGALTSNYVNPTNTTSGLFGGEVAALKLNVDFADAGLTLGSSGIPFGDLTLCGFTDLADLNGLSLRQFLAVVNIALGGGSAPYAIDPDLASVTFDVDPSFRAGIPTQFAQDHLVYGVCP
jgi:hypothetical protein